MARTHQLRQRISIGRGSWLTISISCDGVWTRMHGGTGTTAGSRVRKDRFAISVTADASYASRDRKARKVNADSKVKRARARRVKKVSRDAASRVSKVLKATSKLINR